MLSVDESKATRKWVFNTARRTECYLAREVSLPGTGMKLGSQIIPADTRVGIHGVFIQVLTDSVLHSNASG